jgi:hypothetical protein
MTSVAPPTEFFPGIDFNPSFYNLGQSAVSLEYLQSNYLRSTGYSISRAQFTLFNGTVDINENLDVSGNINASAYLLNGVPFTPSQWTTSVNDIYYTTGNVGIGKTNPTYKLDVSGNINCNAIFRAGTELTQYTDANVRTVLGTSAGTNMTWNTGTNKFDVATPYTDTNVRTVLSTSAGTNMTWNTGTNKFDVSVPPSYTDTNTRTVLSTSAGTNMTWNTGTNKFDVAAPYTDTNTRTVLSTSAGTNMTWNTGTNKFDVAIPTNPWVSNTSGIYYKPPTVPIGQFSYVGINKTNPSFELDVSGSIFSQNFFHFGGYVGIGISNPANVISGYPFQSIGNAYFSQGVAFNTTINTGVSWPGTNSVLGRAQFALGYANSTGAGDVILKSGVKLHLQSGNGEGGITVNTLNNVGIGTTAPNYKLDVVRTINATELRVNGTVFTGASQWTTNGTNIYNNNTGNVFIGASTNSSDDGNVNIAIPDSTFYVRGPRTAGTTTNISFRGGLEGNNNGKVRIWMSSDAAHSSYIQSEHEGNGWTNLSFGTSGGNALPTEKMRITPFGSVGIGITDPNSRLHVHRENATISQTVVLLFTDTLTGTTASDGLLIGKGDNNHALFYNNENTPIIFATNGGEKMRIAANGAVGIQDFAYAIPNNNMARGSLAIGNINQNYGGGNQWNSSTAGLMMECADATEIAVHDSGASIHSLMYYSTNGNITIGRNMGWGVANVNMNGALIVSSYILSNSRIYSRNGGFDTWIYSDSAGMYLNMGNQSTENAPTYFRMGAYSSRTFYESNQSRNHRFQIYTGTFNGTTRVWEFDWQGGAFNALNTSSWTVACDQRIKENIVKADLKTCYDNIKNINLYRFNYIDAFETASTDKNKLGYIAQQVKKHFPKATFKIKNRLKDKREIPDLLTVDVEQVNLTLYGAVKQLIKIVEKQNKRIKTLETLLNIDDDDEVENDAGEAYERIYDEEECDIDDIEPTEPSNEV